MSTYVIGDIHGCYREFIEMLNLIHISEEDEVICVGDYIDRGDQNYEMLKWIEFCPYNILLLQGNHEAEFIANVEILNNFANKLDMDINNKNDTQLLYQVICMIPQIKNAYFDNYKTIYELIYNHSVVLSQIIKWANIMTQMPYKYIKTINNVKHIIVHAGYKKDDINFYIYSRQKTYIKDCIIIAGHTPTIFKKEFAYNDGNIYIQYNKQLNSTYINVDCGCVYKNNYNNSKLGCIRLEDMQKFYI